MKSVSTGKTSPASRTDWPRVRAMTNDDIRHDADSPATVPGDWEGAIIRKGGAEVGHVRTRGPNKRPVKQQTAIRFDEDVLAGLRATGKGWQTRVNDAMREWLKAHSHV